MRKLNLQLVADGSPYQRLKFLVNGSHCLTWLSLARHGKARGNFPLAGNSSQLHTALSTRRRLESLRERKTLPQHSPALSDINSDISVTREKRSRSGEDGTGLRATSIPLSSLSLPHVPCAWPDLPEKLSEGKSVIRETRGDVIRTLSLSRIEFINQQRKSFFGIRIL